MAQFKPTGTDITERNTTLGLSDLVIWAEKVIYLLPNKSSGLAQEYVTIFSRRYFRGDQGVPLSGMKLFLREPLGLELVSKPVMVSF